MCEAPGQKGRGVQWPLTPVAVERKPEARLSPGVQMGLLCLPLPGSTQSCESLPWLSPALYPVLRQDPGAQGAVPEPQRGPRPSRPHSREVWRPLKGRKWFHLREQGLRCPLRPTRPAKR